MEHNSVLRPLRFLEATRNIKISVVPANTDGTIDPSLIEKSLRPETRLLILGHASNVTGTIAPVREVAALARKHGVHFLVDAAQTAGSLHIDVENMNIDLLAFTGHKSLLGPQGTGGLYIREGLDTHIAPLMAGGTGSRSEFAEQPDFMPDKYESGTPNTIGLAGLKAGIAFIQGKGIETIYKKEQSLLKYFLSGLQKLPNIKLYGPAGVENRISVVSFNIDDMASSDVAFSLDEKYGILCRPGLHCAPHAHRTIGTFPQGTVRFGFGYYNTLSQIKYALRALEEIAQKGKDG
jgi:cysteine desulfurase family protein